MAIADHEYVKISELVLFHIKLTAKRRQHIAKAIVEFRLIPKTYGQNS